MSHHRHNQPVSIPIVFLHPHITKQHHHNKSLHTTQPASANGAFPTVTSLFALPWPGQQLMVNQIPRTRAQEQPSNSVSPASSPQARAVIAASFQTGVYLISSSRTSSDTNTNCCQVICPAAENPKSTAKSTADDKHIWAKLLCPQINYLLLWTRETLNVLSF